jgi:hypothetical protein
VKCAFPLSLMQRAWQGLSVVRAMRVSGIPVRPFCLVQEEAKHVPSRGEVVQLYKQVGIGEGKVTMADIGFISSWLRGGTIQEA